MLPSLIFPDLPQIKLIKTEREISLLRFFMESLPSFAACPDCQCFSTKIHSYYCRKIEHLPCLGFCTEIRLKVPRFYCTNQDCSQKTFAERFLYQIQSYARKSDTIKQMYSHTSLYLGGRVGRKYLRKLGMKIGLNTLLRLVYRYDSGSTSKAIRVLGVDDWAFRKGEYYGTVLVDLENRQVVDLLPDRDSESLANWLKIILK